MTQDAAVRISNVSKVFRIGMRDDAPDSLAAAMTQALRNPIQNYRKYRSLYRFGDLKIGELRRDVVWALTDVSFDVPQGEVLGIIGHNGAGKSTLLKILTRITPPTHGEVQIRGRVSSLLEVGTGFHRELTGRENIYLNGTVLGMTKQEIDRKFDEIVEFSAVERFLDTPVKRYSSGMAVRLAFAVAAHLEPEILIIDEVLAVGDAAFQKKCINKMQDVGKAGRTVLVVSHNMPAIRALCDRAILLREGRQIMDGSPEKVISAYMTAEVGIPSAREWPDPERAPGGEAARLRAARIVSKSGRSISSVDVTEAVGIQMEYEVVASGHVLMPHFYVHNEEGALLFGTLNQEPKWCQRQRAMGRYTSTAWIPGNLLVPGTYHVGGVVLSRNTDTSQFYEKQMVAFTVTDNMGEGTARGDWAGWMGGVIRPLLEWDTVRHDDREFRTA